MTAKGPTVVEGARQPGQILLALPSQSRLFLARLSGGIDGLTARWTKFACSEAALTLDRPVGYGEGAPNADRSPGRPDSRLPRVVLPDAHRQDPGGPEDDGGRPDAGDALRRPRQRTRHEELGPADRE